MSNGFTGVVPIIQGECTCIENLFGSTTAVAPMMMPPSSALTLEILQAEFQRFADERLGEQLNLFSARIRMDVIEELQRFVEDRVVQPPVMNTALPPVSRQSRNTSSGAAADRSAEGALSGESAGAAGGDAFEGAWTRPSQCTKKASLAAATKLVNPASPQASPKASNSARVVVIRSFTQESMDNESSCEERVLPISPIIQGCSNVPAPSALAPALPGSFPNTIAETSRPHVAANTRPPGPVTPQRSRSNSGASQVSNREQSEVCKRRFFGTERRSVMPTEETQVRKVFAMETIRTTAASVLRSKWTGSTFSGLSLQHLKEVAIVMDSKYACRRYTMAIVGNQGFDFFTTALIVLNAVAIGAQADYSARNPTLELPEIMQNLDTAFCIVFTAELAVRMIAYGRSFFNVGPDLKWNLFDCSMVALQLFEEIIWRFASILLNGDGNIVNVSFLRVLKVLRLMRIVRLVRVLHFVAELRNLVSSVANSMHSLGWTLLLLFFIIYLVGVCFTHIVSDHWPEEGPEEDDVLNEYFGSLLRTLLSLFQAISGGIDWDVLVSPLNERVSPLAGLLFTMYIGFAVLALLNVVTGVFVDSALQSAEKDKDLILVNRLKEIISKANTDMSGTMTMEEFDSMCEEDDMRLQFEAIDLDLFEARELFLLLDVHDDGVVDKDKFIQGCLRLRGSAQAMDLATVMFDAQRNNLKTQQALKRIEEGQRLAVGIRQAAGDQGRTCVSEQKADHQRICCPLQDKGDIAARSSSESSLLFGRPSEDLCSTSLSETGGNCLTVHCRH